MRPTPETNSVGISSSALFGVHIFRGNTKPAKDMNVIWIWGDAGQITAGDYYNGVARDATFNYQPCSVQPTHWMPWPENWPSTPNKETTK